MDYKPLKHLGLDHDLDHYNLDGTPKAANKNAENVPVLQEIIEKTLDVIRQDKSKLVEEEYHAKDWVMPKLEQIKKDCSLNIHTVVTSSSVNVRDNIVSLDITTSNLEANHLTTTMQILFFNGGILKFNCINAASPSKFSFELVEEPQNITPYNLKDKVNVQDEGLTVEMDEQAKLTVKFNPFSVSIVSEADEPLFELNRKKSLMFDENLTADFTFHTEFLYGIPERAHHVFVEDTKHDLPYRFFNLDIFGYAAFSKNGLYGCIPLMITRKKDSSKWVSMYWQNTSESYAEIHKENGSSDTYWISERGNLEAYVFVNNSVTSHYQSITNVLGKSAMPQYFSLGYHQCRYSYNDQQDLLQVNQKFNDFEIPCDTLTLDIDHTNEMRYFTWNYDLFPDPVRMQDTLVRDKRKLITIADPHIKVDDNYSVYKGAMLQDLCIKDKDNKVFVGECWPGDSIYLDYLNEETRDYWASCYKYENYKDSTPNLFAWNDMNEPSVFESKDKTLPKTALHTVKRLSEPEKAFQVEHREVHNIFGYTMSKATYAGLLRRNEDQNIRPHALSRSFFAGSQKWCTIWTGDTLSSWEHLKISVPMLLSMSLCGLSFVGSDVGGFVGDPEPELMVRWYQVGIFMPYFRGHSDKRCKRREPWLYPAKPFELVKDTIKERYKLLAYWYTVFEDHCRTGMPIMRPVWMDSEAILSKEMLNDEDRFMLGDSILVEPILEPGKAVIAEPLRGMQGRWYNYYSRQEMLAGEEDNIGIERIGVYIKGGKCVPVFDVRTYMKSSKDVREGNITLLVGLDEEEQANGTLYVDDGETFDYRKGSFTRKSFEFKGNELKWSSVGESKFEVNNRVTKVVVMGLKGMSFKGAYLQGEDGVKKSVQVVKGKDNVTLEFVALANKDWKIVLQ